MTRPPCKRPRGTSFSAATGNSGQLRRRATSKHRSASCNVPNSPPLSTCCPATSFSWRSASTDLLGPARWCHHCRAAAISRGGGVAVAGLRWPGCADCWVVVKGVGATRLGIDRIRFCRGGCLWIFIDAFAPELRDAPRYSRRARALTSTTRTGRPR